MTYKIEKGILVPPAKRGGKKGKSKYPFDRLEIGDSFLIENPPISNQGYPITIASVYSKRFAPKKFTQRSEGTGLRIWRVE